MIDDTMMMTRRRTEEEKAVEEKPLHHDDNDLDHLVKTVDVDELIRENRPSDRPGNHSLISYLSFPEMDALIGWATHQVGPQMKQSKEKRNEKEEVEKEEEEEESSSHNHSRSLCLPSASPIGAPPSLLADLQEHHCLAASAWPVTATSIHSALLCHKLGWNLSATPTTTSTSSTGTTSTATTTFSPAMATTGAVALGCVIEEILIETLMPLALTYVEHVRQQEAKAQEKKEIKEKAKGRRTAAASAPAERLVVPALEPTETVAPSSKRRKCSRMTMESYSAVNVDAWTVPPEEAIYHMLFLNEDSEKDSLSFQRRSTVLKWLEQWQYTELLVQSCRLEKNWKNDESSHTN